MSPETKEKLMKFNYSPEVSLGNLLQIFTILFGIAAAYGALQQADIRHESELKIHSDAIVEIKQRQEKVQEEVKTEIKEVKKGVEGINEKLTGVLIENARQSNRR